MGKLLEQLAHAAGSLAPYLQVDFSSWVELHRSIPLGLGVAMVALGLLACTLGHRPIPFRLISAPLAAAAGWRLAPLLSPHLHISSAIAASAGAGALGAVALAWPPVILGGALGLFGGLAGGELAGRADYWAGFAAGFLLLGAVGIAAHRLLAVVVSAVAGLAVLVLGTLSALSYTSLGGAAASFPSIDAAAAAGLAILSMAYQLRFGETDEDRERARQERARPKRGAGDPRPRDKQLKSFGGRAARG